MAKAEAKAVQWISRWQWLRRKWSHFASARRGPGECRGLHQASAGELLPKAIAVLLSDPRPSHPKWATPYHGSATTLCAYSLL